MSTGIGNKSFVLVGKEGTIGTAATAAQSKLEIVELTLAQTTGVIEDGSLNNVVASRRSIVAVGGLTKVTMRVRCNFDGLGQLYKALLPTITGPTGTTPVILHTFKENVTQASFTLEISMGDAPTTAKVVRITGTYLTSLGWRGQASKGTAGMVEVSAEWLGQTMTPDVTAGMTDPGFPLSFPVHFIQAQTASGQLSDGTADAASALRVRNVEVQLSRPFDENRYFFGSGNPDVAVQNGWLDCMWRFTEEYNSKAILDASRLQTPVGVTNGLIVLFKDAVSLRTLKLQSKSAVLESASVPISGPGIVTQSVSWRAFYNTADTSCITVTTESADTSWVSA